MMAAVSRSCAAWSMRPPRMISRLAKMFSATERLPKRLSSWNTMPMPWLIASAVSEKTTGSPSSRMRPAVGRSTPAMIFISVDLPAPFSPTSTLTAPLPDLEIGLLHGNRAGIDLRHAFEPQDDVRVARSCRASRHGFGPNRDFDRRHQRRVGRRGRTDRRRGPYTLRPTRDSLGSFSRTSRST